MLLLLLPLLSDTSIVVLGYTTASSVGRRLELTSDARHAAATE